MKNIRIYEQLNLINGKLTTFVNYLKSEMFHCKAFEYMNMTFLYNKN